MSTNLELRLHVVVCGLCKVWVSLGKKRSGNRVRVGWMW